MNNLKQYSKLINERVAAQNMLTRMGAIPDGDMSYEVLKGLLGAYDVIELTDDQENTLKLLAGPHGEVYYKMILARKQDAY